MVGLLLLGVLASAAILLLLGRKKADMALLRPLEGESGWSHYSKAMELLPRRVEYSGTNLVELAGRLREAEPALEEIRRGLALPNQMPGDPEFVKNLAHSTTLKSLASALVAASRVEADRGNWTNAVERAREAIRFGQEVSRGVVLHALVGVAIEKMGVRQLVSLAGNLEDATLWEVGDWLRETEGRTEPWEKIARREREGAAGTSATPGGGAGSMLDGVASARGYVEAVLQACTVSYIFCDMHLSHSTSSYTPVCRYKYH